MCRLCALCYVRLVCVLCWIKCVLTDLDTDQLYCCCSCIGLVRLAWSDLAGRSAMLVSMWHIIENRQYGATRILRGPTTSRVSRRRTIRRAGLHRIIIMKLCIKGLWIRTAGLIGAKGCHLSVKPKCSRLHENVCN